MEEKPATKYFLDLGLFERNNRDFSLFVHTRLCNSCTEGQAKKRKSPTTESEAQALLTTIRRCCSKTPDFFPPDLPIKEAVFRVFLANQEPLDAEEVHQQLEEHMGSTSDRRDISSKTLERLLHNGGHYGLRRVEPTPVA